MLVDVNGEAIVCNMCGDGFSNKPEVRFLTEQDINNDERLWVLCDFCFNEKIRKGE